MVEEPRPTCPECGAIIDPRHCVSVSNRDESPMPDLFETGCFSVDKFSGIYCCADCVIEAFERGYPEHRGVVPDEND